jgi:hypothetical protein
MYLHHAFASHGRSTRAVLHGALLRIVASGEHARKHRVHPLDDMGKGAEIRFEAQRLEPQAPEPLLLQADEQTDLRLPEAIDRLHRVAHAEQRATVAVGPARRQTLQQVELAERRVLELVDQDVLQSVVERECEIGRVVGRTERAQRAQRDFDIVRLALRLEHELQLRHCRGQQLEQCFERAPLILAVERVRQCTQRREIFQQALVGRDGAQQREHAALHRTIGRRKTVAHVHRLVNIAILLEQHRGDGAPDLQTRTVRIRRLPA